MEKIKLIAASVLNKIKDLFSVVLKKKNSPDQDKNNKIGVILVLATVAIGIIYYFRSSFISATVNGQPIFRHKIIKTLESKGGKEELESLIMQTLIYQEAMKQKINTSDEEINKEVENIRSQLKNAGQDLDALLVAQQINIKDFESQIRMQKTVEKLLQDKINVTEEEINAFIEQNKSMIPENMTEEEIKNIAMQDLRSQKMSTEFENWYQLVKTKSDIKYLVEY